MGAGAIGVRLALVGEEVCVVDRGSRPFRLKEREGERLPVGERDRPMTERGAILELGRLTDTPTPAIATVYALLKWSRNRWSKPPNAASRPLDCCHRLLRDLYDGCRLLRSGSPGIRLDVDDCDEP